MATNIRAVISPSVLVDADLEIEFNADALVIVGSSLAIVWNVPPPSPPPPTGLNLSRLDSNDLTATWLYNYPGLVASNFIVTPQSRTNANSAWVSGSAAYVLASSLQQSDGSYAYTVPNAPGTTPEWRVMVQAIVNGVNGQAALSPPVGTFYVRQSVVAEMSGAALTIYLQSAPLAGSMLLILWGYDFLQSTVGGTYQVLQGWNCTTTDYSNNAFLGWACNITDYNADGSVAGVEAALYPASGPNPSGTVALSGGGKSVYSCNASYGVGISGVDAGYYPASQWPSDPSGTTSDSLGYYVKTCTPVYTTYTGYSTIGQARNPTFSGPFDITKGTFFAPATVAAESGVAEQFAVGILTVPADVSKTTTPKQVSVNLGQPLNDGIVMVVELGVASGSAKVVSSATSTPSKTAQLSLPNESLVAVVGAAIEPNYFPGGVVPAGYLAPKPYTAAVTSPSGMPITRAGLPHDAHLSADLRWVYFCLYLNDGGPTYTPLVIPPTDRTTDSFVAQTIIVQEST